MKISKEESIEASPSNNCLIWEYRFPSEYLSIARALINGRYPDKGQATNLESEEAYYVLSGSGIVHINGSDIPVNPEDTFVFRKNDEFWVEGNNLSILIINSPPWTPEQHKNIQLD